MSLQLFNLSGAKVSEVSEVKDCEYGSNANGEYWKYANGLLICVHKLLFTTGQYNSWGSIYDSNIIPLTNLPYPFKRLIYGNASISDFTVCYVQSFKPTLTSWGTIQVSRPVPSFDTESEASLFAIGTWK